MRRSSRLLAISVSVLLILTGAALADSCNDFASFECGKTKDIARIGGGVSIKQSVGIELNSNTFNVFTTNGLSGSDVIIVAAFAKGAPSGSLNGISFSSSLGSFPEAGATEAIIQTMQNLNFCMNCKPSFGYVDLGTALSKNGSLSVTASGVPAGTIFYAEILNSDGKIAYITPNSEAAILGRESSPVPEPGSLALMGTGLVAIATQIRRKLRA